MTQAPNILFVIVDQWRSDCLGVTGHPLVETPNLDALARRGVAFTSAYSSCPSCIAARASMFTGMTPSSHGRLGYRDCVPWRYPYSLPGLLGTAGYQTHCIGKTHFFPQRLHFGFQSLESYEAEQNFDGKYVNDYYEFLRDRTGGRETDDRLHGIESNSWLARPSHLPEELHNNTWVATRGCEFLRRRDPTRPFFLNLSFHRPHPPIDPPQVYWDMYAGRAAELPPVPVGDWAGAHAVPAADVNAWQASLPKAALDRARLGYYAQISHIDNQLGRVLKLLRGHGPTWVIFTADHGEMLGDHNLFRKTYAYEGSAGIPFIVCPPQGGAGKLSPAPVLLEDILPTCLEIAGAPVPAAVEGRSLVPLAKGETPAGWREFLHGEHSPCYSQEQGMQFLTDGREKYVWYTLSGREQFFDLQNDRQECHDLAADPAAAGRLGRWRQRLVERLAARPQDGLSDGRRLLPGKNLPAVRAELLDGKPQAAHN